MNKPFGIVSIQSCGLDTSSGNDWRKVVEDLIDMIDGGEGASVIKLAFMGSRDDERLTLRYEPSRGGFAAYGLASDIESLNTNNDQTATVGPAGEPVLAGLQRLTTDDSLQCLIICTVDGGKVVLKKHYSRLQVGAVDIPSDIVAYGKSL